ncbi:uncharacterized protein FFB14_15826 [Fusarium fujikuroi]|nr:uncharacterized protein FFB14_15826 [Fusarium fujikuroi]
MAPLKASRERIDRLRSLLQPAASSTTSSRASGHEKSNLLTSIALHALVRTRRGETLTSVEKMMSGLYEAAVDDEAELDAYVEVVISAKKQSRATGSTSPGSLVPSIAALGDDEPYTMEQLKKDFADAFQSRPDRPNCRIIDPGNPSVMNGDTTAFDEAVAETGRGVTVFWSEPPAAASGDTAQARVAGPPDSHHVELRPSSFHCIRRSGEVGKDEIYWSLAAGADTFDQLTQKQVTDEFGSIVAGSWPSFPANVKLFDGVVENVLAAHIVCWEADHSNSAWYNKLIEVSRAISRKSSEMSVITGDSNWDELIGQLPGYSMRQEVLFWVQIVADAIANFLDLFRNDDDKVKEHYLAWNIDALNQMYRTDRGEYHIGVMFDGGGGGKHELFINRYPAGDATAGKFKSMISRSPQTTWSSPSPMEMSNLVGASITHYEIKDKFWGATSRQPDSALIVSPELYIENHRQEEHVVPGHTCTTLPALVSTREGLHVVYAGTDQNMHTLYCSASDTTWTHTPMSGKMSAIGPALGVLNDVPVCIHYGLDGRFHYDRFRHGSWMDGCALNLPAGKQTPTLCAYRGSLYILYTDREERLRVAVLRSRHLIIPSADIEDYGLDPHLTRWPPAAAVWNDTIYVAYGAIQDSENNGRIYICSLDVDNRSLRELHMPEAWTVGGVSLNSNSDRLLLVYPARR